MQTSVAGKYGLSGELVDASDNFVTHANILAELGAGSNVLALRFDGDAIGSSRRNGPYALTNLLLTDHNDATLVAQEASSVYTTRPYRYSDFDASAIYLPLVLR